MSHKHPGHIFKAIKHMPQWRKLHLKTVESMDINEMPDDFTRLMWITMPLGLDSAGRGIDDAAWIKSKLFPLRRDVSYEIIESAMVWYDERNMIERYEVDGRKYFMVPTFQKYQGNTEREAESLLPEPVTTNSRPTHDQLTKESCSDVDADSDADANIGAKKPRRVSGRPEERAILEAFCEESGIPEPHPRSEKEKKSAAALWYQPVRRMFQLADGRGPDLARQAVRQLRRSNLTISNPSSIEKTFSSILGKLKTRSETPEL